MVGMIKSMLMGGSGSGVGVFLIDPDRFRTPKLKNNPD